MATFENGMKAAFAVLHDGGCRTTRLPRDCAIRGGRELGDILPTALSGRDHAMSNVARALEDVRIRSRGERRPPSEVRDRGGGCFHALWDPRTRLPESFLRRLPASSCPGLFVQAPGILPLLLRTPDERAWGSSGGQRLAVGAHPPVGPDRATRPSVCHGPRSCFDPHSFAYHPFRSVSTYPDGG